MLSSMALITENCYRSSDFSYHAHLIYHGLLKIKGKLKGEYFSKCSQEDHWYRTSTILQLLPGIKEFSPSLGHCVLKWLKCHHCTKVWDAYQELSNCCLYASSGYWHVFLFSMSYRHSSSPIFHCSLRLQSFPVLFGKRWAIYDLKRSWMSSESVTFWGLPMSRSLFFLFEAFVLLVDFIASN